MVASVLAIPVAIYLIGQDATLLVHSAQEYFSFIVLLGSLFIVTGGICLEGDLQATPRNNALFLGLGSILASLIGTTGASMLLIRALLKTNKERHHVRHIPIFFIFMVSNAGGMLTPIGDPPLFLGYLRGVPFFWTFKLFPIWLTVNGILLFLFYMIDRQAWQKETKKDQALDRRLIEPLRLSGKANLPLLLGVIASVFLPSPVRETVMVVLSLVSLKLTPPTVHRKNHFSFHPIIEVAVLFAGIFVTMAPALWLLEHQGGTLGITKPAQFFWMTGFLSSFLDNAPTYLTFLSLAQGLDLPGATVVGVTEPVLLAISAGAVLMGANTYIGNGPNFMVKAITDHAGIKTPSFFGYMAWAGLFLFPLHLLVTFLFFV